MTWLHRVILVNVALEFRNGLEYRNSNFESFSVNDLAT